MLNPLHLVALRRVLATGSLSAAAQELGYSASAVSQQISALERSVGVDLFERGPRSLRPTPAGIHLGAGCVEPLAGLAALESQMAAFADGSAGRVRVGTYAAATTPLVAPLIVRLAAERPEVAVTVEEGEPAALLARLREGALDVALVHECALAPRSRPADLRYRLVTEERMVVLLPAGHRLAGRASVRLRELADEPWVGAPEASDEAQALARACALAGIEPELPHRCADQRAVRQLVARRLGLAIVPALAAAESCREVVAVRLLHEELERRVLVVCRAREAGRLTARCVAALRRIGRERGSGSGGAVIAPVARPAAPRAGR